MIDRIHYFKRNLKNNEQKTRPKKNSFLQKFVNYIKPRKNDRDIIKITTIVEHIQKRSKRDTESEGEPATLSNEVNSSKSPIRSKNVKKVEGTPQNSHNSSLKDNTGKFEKSTIHRRHRRSTVDATLKDRKTRANDKRDDRNKPPKPLYKPVFKECNDTTAASEIDDLNILPPRSKYSKPPISLVNKKIIDLPRIETENSKLSALESAGGTKKLLKSLPFTLQQSAGYVNLRDHQEESRTKNKSGEAGKDSSTLGYPKDIKPYNPDIIPYVDVPDYTDQREESLDEDDRRVAKERHSIDEINGGKRNPNVNDDDDVDVVDPDGPEASESLPDQPKNPESLRNKDKSKSLKDGHKDAQSGRGKILDLSSQNAEDNDDNDRSGKDEISSENTDERIENRLKLLQKSPSLQTVDHKFEKADKIEDEVEYHRKDDHKPISSFEPVYFDIADYVKPFNYHKLFKDEESHDAESASEFISEGLPEASAEIFSDQYEKLVAVKPEDFYFEDKEFFQPILAHKQDKPDKFDGESDFLAKYFTHDVIGQFENSENEKLQAKESSEEDKEESYETLPTNLQNKNHNVQEDNRQVKVKDGPKDYKKFWTLEYSFPPKKTANYEGGKKPSHH